MTRVVCVGDLMVDVHAALSAPLAHGSDSPARIELRHGGAAANVAAWLATFGARSMFVGRVGDDALGEAALRALHGCGVHTQVAIDPALPTGSCIVLVDVDGERTMVPSAGANDATLDLDATAVLDGADWLYVSGYSLLRAATRPAVLALIDSARRGSIGIAVDAASAAPLDAFGADNFRSSVGPGVTLFANLDEATVLLADAASPHPDAAAHELAARYGQAIIKLGAGGAVWSDGAAVERVPAQGVDVIDTTGAGDAFAAGFLAGGPSVADRLASGTAAGAAVVVRLGARPPEQTA